MNYWTYFNSNPKVEPADLVVFDDAHLAEQPLTGMFAIRIDRRTQGSLYERLCDLVLAHTDLYPSIELMAKGARVPVFHRNFWLFSTGLRSRTVRLTF